MWHSETQCAQNKPSSFQLKDQGQVGRKDTSIVQVQDELLPAHVHGWREGGKQLDERPEEPNLGLFVKENIDKLAQIITTEFGLTYRLISGDKSMSSRTMADVERHFAYDDKATSLLYKICGRLDSKLHLQALFDALDLTHHRHVTNFIRGKGQRSADFGDNWPLRWCEAEELSFQNNRFNLAELIDSKNGLLNEMLALDCINDRMLQRIETYHTDTDRNEQLLAIVRRGSLADYNKFIQCLLQTHQHQVVSLIAPSLVGDINLRPLSDDQQSRLNMNYASLVNSINSNGSVIDELFTAGCITRLQLEYIEAATRESEKNKRLINIVRRGCQLNYHKFIECLNKTGQDHVSKLLMELHP